MLLSRTPAAMGGMYPLMHAIDQSSWCLRACQAALELIPQTSVDLINKPIECAPEYRSGMPVGHYAIHPCAHGCDTHNKRPEIMRLLIKRKAEVNILGGVSEQRDQITPQHTFPACLLRGEELSRSRLAAQFRPDEKVRCV